MKSLSVRLGATGKGERRIPKKKAAKMDDTFLFADSLGPTKIVHLYDPAIDLKAVVAIDNVAIGPAMGGIRLAPDVSAREAFRLARSMTLKNAAAGLPHGGGKSVIFGDPRMPLPQKERLIRAFAQAIADMADYIPGPDMGIDERCMAWIRDEIGRAVGLPRSVGGIPLDEIGATAWGLFHAIAEAMPRLGLSIEGARVAIQGFGAVGGHAARFLGEAGAVLVAAADIEGAIVNPHGLDIAALLRLRDSGRPLSDCQDAERLERDAIIDVDCDIWVPAARPDVVDGQNVHRLRTRLVAQGANIPFTEEAERILHERGVLVLPDFIANAGGVICASVEYHGGTEHQALEMIEERLRDNTRHVLDRAAEKGCPPREAALEMAQARIQEAMAFGRFAGNMTSPRPDHHPGIATPK